MKTNPRGSLTKIIILFCLLMGTLPAHAQSSAPESEPIAEKEYWSENFKLNQDEPESTGGFSERRTAFETQVLAKPMHHAKILITIPAGTAVKAQAVTLKGKLSQYAKINFKSANKTVTGYVQAQNLGVSPPEKDGLTLVYRIKDGADSSNKPTHIEVFLFKNHQKIASTQYKFRGFEGNNEYTSASISDSESLNQTENIIRIAHLGEACSVPTIGKTWVWNGKQLISLPDTESISEAGIFHHEETLTFLTNPKTNQQIIVKLITDSTVTDDTVDSDNPKYEITKSHKEYPWLGKDIIEPKEKP